MKKQPDMNEKNSRITKIARGALGGAILSFLVGYCLFVPTHRVLAMTRASVHVDGGPWGGPVNSQTTNSAAVTTSGASYIIVGVTVDCTNGCSGNRVTSVTASGLTFVKLAGGTTPSGRIASEFWGAVSGGALAGVTVTATVSDPSNFALSILSLHNVDTSSPTGVTIGPGAMANNLSATFNDTIAGSMLFATAFSTPYSSSVTAGANTTVYANQNNATQHIRSTSAIAGGTQTISSTGWSSTTAEYAGVEIKGAITSYAFNYVAGANGALTGATPQSVAPGASGTAVTVVPDAHYHFVNWSDSSTQNPRTDTNASGDISVTANLAIDTFTLTYAAGANGTISGSTPQTVTYGADGTAVTAVPDYGYRFVDWSDASTQNPRTDINVTGNLSVTANFTLARGKKIDTTPVVVTPSITIDIPNSSATYKADSVIGIAWSSIDGAFIKYKVYFSSDNGTAWTLIGETSSTSFSWTVPDAGAAQGKIQVEGFDAMGNLLASAVSNGNFMISGEVITEPTETTPPAVDQTATRTYTSAEALENTPNIDIDKHLVAPTGTVNCTAGSLIKASLPSVYYCGADGKRYAFVNDRIFFSWYKNFSGVKIISDADLASIPLGGNATYRPGKKMIKIQSDPKVYVISRGGVLRWVMTEAKARELFGANWNQEIDDVSDAFFVNYTIGAKI